jgi:hypothetical protein
MSKLPPISRFLPTPDDDSTSYQHILYENYAATMQVSQMIEGKLCIILMGLDHLGLAHVDYDAYRLRKDRAGVLEACIGQVIYILQEHTHFDLPPAFFKHIKKANMYRNMLAHRFFLLNERDMLTERGCVRASERLLRVYTHLTKVHMMLEEFGLFLFEAAGVSREELDRRAEALLREVREEDESEA